MRNIRDKSLQIITITILGLILSGCGETKLTDEEIKKIAICENSDKGVKRFNKSISTLVFNGRLQGISSSVTKNGNELKFILAPNSDHVEFLFKKIDEGELSKYDITCYEIQSIEGNGKKLTRQDKTLNGMTIMPFFGITLPSEQEKRENKAKLDKKNAEFKAKRAKDVARANKEWEEALTIQNNINIVKDKLQVIIQNQNNIDFVATNIIDLCNTILKLFPNETQYKDYFNNLLTKAQSASTEKEKRNILYNGSIDSLEYKITNKFLYNYEQKIQRAKTRFENARDGFAISFN